MFYFRFDQYFSFLNFFVSFRYRNNSISKPFYRRTCIIVDIPFAESVENDEYWDFEDEDVDDDKDNDNDELEDRDDNDNDDNNSMLMMLNTTKTIMIITKEHLVDTEMTK